MNALINNEKSHYPFEEEKENVDKKTFGDIFAVSLLSIFTLSTFIIGSWTLILLLIGDTSNGGPIGFIFNKLLSSMIA